MFCRARTKFPMLIAAPSLIYTISSYAHFAKSFAWTNLPFTEASFHEQTKVDDSQGLCYIQPEFMTDGQRNALESATQCVGSPRSLKKSKSQVASSKTDLESS